MYRKQFLLTKTRLPIPNLYERSIIGNYTLYLGEDSEYEFIPSKDSEFHLLGSLFDWENPHLSNKQILEKISTHKSIAQLIQSTHRYSGEFVLITKLENKLYLFNDATGQKEVYYDESYRCFGTQPKLLGMAIELQHHTDAHAIAYYQSKQFQKNCLFIGNTSHKKNVFHLLPNHLLQINEKSCSRFYPSKKINKIPLKTVAKKGAEMLKGYITSMSQRKKLKIAITGGYDSRILFLTSLHLDCEYFVYQNHTMPNSHHDIKIPLQLTGIYKKSFTVENDTMYSKTSEKNVDYIHDIDFPRYLRKPNQNQEKQTIINGNISEIARNFYGYHKKATATDLCFLAGYSNWPFPSHQYLLWLQNKSLFHRKGYHYLDMFYWEEKMGNWLAKTKTEMNALGIDMLSPFNSRGLLGLLLSTKRRHRDSHFNRLYDLMISELSDKKLKLSKLPINPCLKQRIIRSMKSLNIYNSYRHIGLKSRLLRI